MKDFTDYDYQDLIDHITEKMKEKEGFTDDYEGTTAQTLIQLLADTTDQLHYMLERRSQEAFLLTALLPRSIWAHASEVGYRPRRSIGASGQLHLCLQNEDGEQVSTNTPITIPKGTSIRGASGGDFVTTRDVVLNVGDDDATIPVKQGVEEIHTFSFSVEPQLSSGEILIENYEDIDEYSISISEGNEQYYDIRNPEDSRFVNVTSLNFASKNDPLYEIFYSREGMRIVFGDGIFGKKPSGVVRVRFLRTEGNDVVYMKKGNQFNFETPTINPDFISALDAPRYFYDIVNITPIQGGRAEETIQEIQEFAPAYTRTANRAVTSSDYEFWAKQSGIGDIVDIKAYGEHETGDLIFTINNVYLSYLTSSGENMNIEQKMQLREFLDIHKTLTHHLVINKADTIDIINRLKIRKNRLFPVSNSHFYSIIRRKIEEYFEIKEGSIGRFLQHSELVKYLQTATHILDGVEYDITDYVRLDLEGEYKLVMPPEVFEVAITIEGYTPTNGDTFILDIDGQLFQVPIVSDDSIISILAKMRDEIFFDSNDGLLVSLDVDEERLFIRSRRRDNIFSVNISNGTIAEYVEYNVIHQLPVPESDVSIENKLLPGTVTVVDGDGIVIFEDDGQGKMIPTDPSNGSEFGIEYDEARLVSPRILDGEFYVRFQQNEYMNFRGNYKTAIVLSPFAERLEDEALKSTITIITRD